MEDEANLRAANSTLGKMNGQKLLPIVGTSGSSMQERNKQMHPYLRANTQNLENSILSHSPEPMSRG